MYPTNNKHPLGNWQGIATREVREGELSIPVKDQKTAPEEMEQAVRMALGRDSASGYPFEFLRFPFRLCWFRALLPIFPEEIRWIAHPDREDLTRAG